MPIERIDRDLRDPSAAVRSIAAEPVRLLGLLVAGVAKLLGALFMLWAFSGLLFVGLALVFGVYQFVGRVVGFVPPEATPVVTVAQPVPAPPLVKAWSPRAPAGPITSDLPELGVDRKLITFPPMAVLCGIGLGPRIDIVPCKGRSERCSGSRSGEAPHGPATDCVEGLGRVRARAGGSGSVGTISSDAPHVERWVHSPNPWSIPGR